MGAQTRIRTGMIRCDLHAIYYGNLIQQHDPHVLREPAFGKGGYFYFYTYYNDPRKIAFPRVRGFEITRVWDEDRRLAENMSRIYCGKPRVCDTLEAASDDVDLVFIADCNGDGSDHLELATPGLKKRIPTFVDKPFAYDLADAHALIQLAERHHTPVMSLSMLRVLPHATRFRNRFGELGEPEFGIVKGGGETMAGHIHAISLAQHLFGAGVASVEAMGQTPLAYVHLDYGGRGGNPKDGVVLNCASGGSPHCAMFSSAYSKLGAIHSPAFGDFEFPYAVVEILKMIKKMVKRREPQAPYEEMIECIAIATAARLSQRTRKRVLLDSLPVS